MSPTTPSRSKVAARERQEQRDTTPCRNIFIYGSCRFESTCPYNHNTSAEPLRSPKLALQDLSLSKLTVDSPSFTPASLRNPALLSTSAATAAPFMPLSLDATVSGLPSGPASSQQVGNLGSNPYVNLASCSNNIGDYGGMATPGMNNTGLGFANLHTAPPGPLSAMGGACFPAPYEQLPVPGTTPFAAFPGPGYQAAIPHESPQYHLYAPVGPEPLPAGKGNVRTSEVFLQTELREDLQKKQAANCQLPLPNSPLPYVVGEFHSLVPLETTAHNQTSSFGFSTWVYKATWRQNARPYCLRRLDNFQLSNVHAVKRVNEWKNIWCASIVHIEDAFTTSEFGDSSLVFVQDYYPCAKTLLEHHFSSFMTAQGQYRRPPIPEATLWSYLTQLTHALRTIHGAGATARCIDLSKIIVTEKNRIRLSGCAILDVVKYSEQTSIPQLQLEDLEKVGRVMLALMTGNPTYATTVLYHGQAAGVLSSLQQQYRHDLIGVVSWLLAPLTPHCTTKTVTELGAMIQSKVFVEFDMALSRNDLLFFELGREVEHGRIARLMMKINVVVDRPEGRTKTQETESTYLARLFRDYVFHQVDSAGDPEVDLGHIMECLNKCDVGTDEHLCLTSPDDQTIFVVSYAEIKRHIQIAFDETIRGGVSAVYS